MSLIAELKRRKVFKVGAAYLVVAWLAVQMASIGFPTFDAPPWALRVFILVVFLGFPLALVMAWIFEVTPEGVKVDAAKTGSKRVFVVATALAALSIGWYFYGQPSFRKSDPVTPPAGARTATGPGPGSSAAPSATPPHGTTAGAPADANSIAVLPFVDMSQAHDQEYFSDGIAEELLNVLAHVGNLQVASRTSAFSFKGKNVPVADIASALRVAHVLEGSVRKQGNRVRITAQLIDAASDKHLWSETYDRDLNDIFAVQQEIAQAIAKELGRALGGAAPDVRVPRATQDATAYEEFLSGRTLLHRRGEGLVEARRLLEDSVARDPNFAQAWASLGALYAATLAYIPSDRREQLPKALAAVERARSLDDTLALPYAVLGRVHAIQGRLLESETQFAAAIKRDARESQTYLWRALLYELTGDLDKAEADLARAIDLDPLFGVLHGWYGTIRGMRGDRAAREAELRRSEELGWGGAASWQALWALSDGNRDRQFLKSHMQSIYTNDANVEALLATIADPAQLPTLRRTFKTNQDTTGVGATLAMVGAYREAIALLLDDTIPADDLGQEFLWMPVARKMIEQPEYIALAERDGQMAWWRARGFPAGCTLLDAPPPHIDCSERWRAEAANR